MVRQGEPVEEQEFESFPVVVTYQVLPPVSAGRYPVIDVTLAVSLFDFKFNEGKFDDVAFEAGFVFASCTPCHALSI